MQSMDAEDFAGLAYEWSSWLRSQNMSPETIRSYMAGLSAYAAYCERAGIEPDLSLRSAEWFQASILAAGRSASTATARLRGVRRFSAWLAGREEIPRDELTVMKAPKGDSRVVDALTPDELKALLGACAGKRFIDIRDSAIVRLAAETGARADELCSMRVYDVQVATGSAVIVRGKGGKGRRVGFGDRTGAALSRYLRARRRHSLAGSTDALWLAERGRELHYDGLYITLRRRAARAGIERFHPHMLRHTMAVNWTAAGGSVTGLMSQGGWSSVDLVQRYLGAAQSGLAIEEARRLGLGDI